MEYADYHHAMAQHAAALTNNTQIHPAMAQIPMLSAAGLNLTVMSSGLATGNQHHLGQVQGHHQIMYQNVQPAQNATHVTHHQQQQQQQQQNHHGNHSGGGHGGHGSHGGGGGGHGAQGGKNAKKKPKVNKDGVPAPKRATTAYINFTQWYREELKKAGRPIPKIGDFGKECAAKWNGMQEEEKKPFLDVAARDRDRYKAEMAIFKPARDANKPKRPGTAFMLFMGDFRKEMAGKEPEGGVAALAKLGGERWRNMTEDDKRPYVEKQNEEKVRYEAAMEEYRRKSGAGDGASSTASSVSTGGAAQKKAESSSDATSPKTEQSNPSGDGQQQTTSNNNNSSGEQQQQQQQQSQQQQVSQVLQLVTSSSGQVVLTPISLASFGGQGFTFTQAPQSESGNFEQSNSSGGNNSNNAFQQQYTWQ